MARQINRLNARRVATLMEPGLYADGNGLYLSVIDTGAKSWRLIFHFRGKRRELGLGRVDSVSLADARGMVAEARRLVSQGLDPKEVWRPKVAVEAAPTFGTVAIDLIDSIEAGWKNQKHRQQWRNTLTTYAASIWDKAVADVDVNDVLKLLRPIWTTKPETASRVRGRIERVLDAAKVRKLRTGENPAAWRGNLALLLAKRRSGPKRHHPAMPFEQVPAFIADLKCRPGLAARALELTILCAVRTSEALQATWAEFDLDEAIWTIPAERMKGGKEHRVALADGAVSLLRHLPADEILVFPGLKANRPLSNMAMEMVLRRMGADRWTVHGFRSSFRDWCGETTNFPREVAEQALAHTVGSEVERAYRRGDALEKRRELMQAWASFVASET